eukprot:CAMPEP_0179439582 /NCGR_PEP_ID=MMETSP0799-20121207/23210_1 /TAXON_ID=46947 /ORGANISM="Geminigera cryophila, Strain CCMP2564" /LENGTH=72 /DNA_ID=CAMNT_0021222133 /DNA_START=16 /DNA_END=234 /DNA_ORIENTATION=-
MGDDQMSASALRNRYGRNGSATDSDLSASQLRARYGVENSTHQGGGGNGLIMVVIGLVVAIAVGAVVFMSNK